MQYCSIIAVYRRYTAPLSPLFRHCVNDQGVCVCVCVFVCVCVCGCLCVWVGKVICALVPGAVMPKWPSLYCSLQRCVSAKECALVCVGVAVGVCVCLCSWEAIAIYFSSFSIKYIIILLSAYFPLCLACSPLSLSPLLSSSPLFLPLPILVFRSLLLWPYDRVLILTLCSRSVSVLILSLSTSLSHSLSPLCLSTY